MVIIRGMRSVSRRAEIKVKMALAEFPNLSTRGGSFTMIILCPSLSDGKIQWSTSSFENVTYFCI